MAKYRLDGTLARRVAAAKDFGNYRVNPGLIQAFKINLERIRLKGLGISEAEIDSRLPVLPPGYGKPGLCNKGKNKIFVLLIDFPDYPASNTNASVNGKIFGNGAGNYPYESLCNYYRRSSYGQLELQGSTLGWYRPAYRRAGVVQTGTGQEDLIKEALIYFDGQGHDFSQYDNDNDGVIDYFLVIWTGPPGEWASFWWGYQTFWSSSFTLDGKQFKSATYSWQWESFPYPGNFSPIVTIHETGHALGLPDLYDYDDSVGPKGGVGNLDMMDGNWGDHNCFSKMLLDWLTPRVCNYGTWTHVVLRPTGGFKDAVIFWPNYNITYPFNEFFMVQNRCQIKNDFNIPADGLLIWHIDATLDDYGGFLYDNSYAKHKLVRLMEADGLEEIEKGFWADTGDFFFTGKRFGINTTPNSSAYSGSRTETHLDTITKSGLDMTCRIWFKGGILNIAINNASFGMTIPAPGEYNYEAYWAQLTAIPNTNCEFINWSGSISSNKNPVTVTMNGPKSISANFRFIYAPIATGRKVLNRSFSQAEYINILSWQANPANQGLDIKNYKIYQMINGIPTLLASLEANRFEFYHREAGQKSIQYAIVAVLNSDREGAPALVTIQ